MAIATTDNNKSNKQKVNSNKTKTYNSPTTGA
jgi:hypothetical protein